jgi:hypothetical protein
MRATASKGEVAGSWDNVVKVYQQAGQQGASVVGPAIDQLSGGSPQTTTLTHRAWGNNGLLANINSEDSATKADADAAKRLCDSMIGDLQTALNLASASPHPGHDPFTAGASHIANSPAPQYHAPIQQYQPPPQQQYQAPPPHDKTKAKDPDDLPKYIVGGGAVGGAIGFGMGGPAGALIGAVIGGLIGDLIFKGGK